LEASGFGYSKKLGTWNNNYVSLGGRVVLINSVLGAIPIFYMSIFKMLVSVRKQIMLLQRRFLWGWALGASKVAWVKWEEVCLLEEKGGLAVEDLRWFNSALLVKWRWRLLNEKEALWKDVLSARCGENRLSTPMI
jgi:hypothetical protein